MVNAQKIIICIAVLMAVLLFIRNNVSAASPDYIHISWQVTNSYAPNDFLGRRLMSGGSFVIISAQYHLTENKKLLTDKDVDFAWNLNPSQDLILNDASRIAVPIDASYFLTNNALLVNLKIQSKTTNSQWQTNIVIPLEQPDIVLKKVDLTSGETFYWNKVFQKNSGVTNIFLVPYYFSFDSLGKFSLQISFAGQTLQGSPLYPYSITFDPALNLPEGQYTLSVNAANASLPTQYTTKNFLIKVTK